MRKNIFNNSQNIESKSNEKSTNNGLDPTETRIEFVKTILKDNILNPMVDFENCDTETENNVRLNKKILNVRNLLLSMNVGLKYLKSGTTGHTFKAISKETNNRDVAFAVKVCAYPKDEYGAMNNLKRPENVELRMLKLLSKFVVKRATPHLVLPIGTFNTSITNFINVPPGIINLKDEKNEMYRKFIDRHSKGEFEDFVSILISEWCNGGDLLDYIRNNYKTMTKNHWTIIFFQILYTLAVIHKKYPNFRHNDMKANNILVEIPNTSKINGGYQYELGNVIFYVPDIKLRIKLWDYDFSCIGGIIDNNKVNSEWANDLNITDRKNQYYDIHYFFNTLISKRFFKNFYDNGAVPQEIIDFVHRIVPEKYRTSNNDSKPNDKYLHKRGRIRIDDEYTTPYNVIMKDPLFKKFRFTK